MNTKPEDLNLAEISKLCADEDKARELLESILWPTGAVCPHCKSQRSYKLNGKPGSKRPARKGLYKCGDCRKQYTVTVGTIFADSHIPISKWMMAIFILCSAKKAISAHQLHRSLGLAYRSAWFMAHRIRHAMSNGPFSDILTGVVEIDETYVGGKTAQHSYNPRTRVRSTSFTNKTPVVSFIQRGGEKRSIVIDKVNGANLREAFNEHVAKDAVVMTDESYIYKRVKQSHEHHTVNHGKKQYALKLGNGLVAHTNTAESSFSLLKRGIIGAFHHVSKKHLPRYVDEFDFRWNHRKIKDGERTIAALRKVTGKRLTLKATKSRTAS